MGSSGQDKGAQIKQVIYFLDAHILFPDVAPEKLWVQQTSGTLHSAVFSWKLNRVLSHT